MKTVENHLVAPCGTNCGICECYTAKDNPELLEYMVSKGIAREKLPCPGCRPLEGNCPVLGVTCKTYDCISKKNHHFCFECQDYPCSKLQPAADRADVLPHNIKVFNLSTIEHQGLEKFIEKSSEIKQRYYKGKMQVGSGPQL